MAKPEPLFPITYAQKLCFSLLSLPPTPAPEMLNS